jgi:VCBS repeat-containing protein
MPLKTTTGTLTTSTGTFPVGLQGDQYTIFLIYGTYTGFTFVFEGTYDGTNWFQIYGIRTDNQAYESGTLSPPSNASRAWLVFNGIWNQLRIRATALSTGSVSVAATAGPGELPTKLPNNLQYSLSNCGTATVNVPAGSGAANSVAVASGPGILHTIQVTTAGATAGAILYDNATTNSGTILYTSAATYALGTQTPLNVVFQNGITVRQAATTAAMTLVYRLF